MGISDKIAQFMEFKRGVSHCTFNPGGPGVVRIHLVPPRPRLFGSGSYVVILNGYYILPIGPSWALVLSAFMREVNKFDARPISEDDENMIFENTVKSIVRKYPAVDRETVEEDLDEILRVLFAVARNDDPEAEIEKLSIRTYAPNMTAPHRMDLMISAMTDDEGAWKCNQKCTFCYAAGQNKSSSKELATEEWKKIIDKLGAARVPMLTFTGGEPTMRDDLCELVAYAKRFITRVNTNGVKLTTELSAALAEAGLDSIQITLYSHDRDIHNELVGARNFDDAVNGIKNALSAGLDVSVNTPLCKKNADYVKTLEFLTSIGVRYATVSGLICTGMAEQVHGEYDLTADELFDAVKSAKDYCDANGMEIDFTSPGLIAREKLESLSMKVPMCGAALSNMAVAPDGVAVPCQSWLTADAGLGNLLTEKFSKTWNSESCKFLRSMSEEEALSCPFREGACEK